MPDMIHELYEKRAYPPMSHPLSDPAVTAVAARMAGLDVAHPRRARILEIGCCSGHNLIPLARRWPECRFTGIDLAARSIDEARDRATRADIGNVDFHAVDLREYAPVDGPFDFIIAHGFFSWVPDEVKAALLVFCHQHLSTNGIATVSFNLECGWKPRLPVIVKARAIQQAGGVDAISALEILKSVLPPDAPEIAIIDDMLAKGPAILAFDDFSPVNDPWPLDRFVQAAANAGLRWLGESDPGENLPSELSEEFLVELRNQVRDPLAYQLAVDEALVRTFRSGVLCRDDAAVLTGFHWKSCWISPSARGIGRRIPLTGSFSISLNPAPRPACRRGKSCRMAMPGRWRASSMTGSPVAGCGRGSSRSHSIPSRRHFPGSMHSVCCVRGSTCRWSMPGTSHARFPGRTTRCWRSWTAVAAAKSSRRFQRRIARNSRSSRGSGILPGAECSPKGGKSFRVTDLVVIAGSVRSHVFRQAFAICFIVIGSSGVTVRQELVKNTRPRIGSSSRDFMGSIGCG